jgi:hypothetical protein
MGLPTRDDGERRWAWTPFLIRLLVALLIATPFVAIVLQAIGKR